MEQPQRAALACSAFLETAAAKQREESESVAVVLSVLLELQEQSAVASAEWDDVLAWAAGQSEHQSSADPMWVQQPAP